MFQSFENTSEGAKGPERLTKLRAALGECDLDGFIVPRADAHQGEYVADCDARLAWLTGFTGSAGSAVVLADKAAVFADGRYAVQVRAQIDQTAYLPVDFPATLPQNWAAEHLEGKAKLGFDPWLHTKSDVNAWKKALAKKDASLVACENLVDVIWEDRPEPPSGKAFAHPSEFAGATSDAKRRHLAAKLREASHKSAVLTLPDSISWLLNIRGSDIPRIPIVHAFAILTDDGKVNVFADPSKFDELDEEDDVVFQAIASFSDALKDLRGPVRLDEATAPYAIKQILDHAGIEIAWAEDPCQLPKACKNETELNGAREAHIRDAVAMIKFLSWVDENTAKGDLDEISVAKKLEGFRRENNLLLDISFETIAASGPNAALPHYRVTDETNRVITPGDILLVDSGGQYRDGTTDITRTVATGPMPDDICAANTRVLKGMIAISRLRFPRGLGGRDLDAIARYPLWLAGQDYDHGTGHGIGSYLSVHEGPQSLSRRSTLPFEEGMIISNEPGYYVEGRFGIRIENLIITRKADEIGDKRDQLSFETITFVPIDKSLIIKDMLTPGEREWLDNYHRLVWERLNGLVDGTTRDWLEQATRPI